jgi:hypothetical protein
VEDTRSDKDTVTSELHHQGSVGGGSDTPGSKVDNWQPLEPGGLLEQVEGRSKLLGVNVELLVGHGGRSSDLGHDSSLVTDGLDDLQGRDTSVIERILKEEEGRKKQSVRFQFQPLPWFGSWQLPR